MAADGSTENFQRRASFLFFEIFGSFKNVQHKILHQNIWLVFFSIRGVAPKIGPKVKKVGPKTKNKKKTLKLK